MRLKREELFKLLNGFDMVKDLPGVKFSYAVAKNKNHIIGEFKPLQKLIEPSKEFLEYDKKRVELCKKHAEKDKNDKPMVKGRNYLGLDDNKAFEDALEKLREEYKEVIDKKDKNAKEYDGLMLEEIEIAIHQIPMSVIPQNITPRQLDLLLPVIIEQ